MISTVYRKIGQRSSRQLLSTLVATEEFPHGQVQHRPIVPSVTKESTLANGIKIITQENSSGLVSMRFAVIGGSRSEASDEKGAAHLIANSAFAGSAYKSGLRLMRELENVGAVVSANSDREKIVYNVSVLAESADAVVGTIAEAIASAPKSTHTIDECRPRAQLSYDAQCPYMQLSELVHDAAYGECSPLGQSMYATKLDYLSSASVQGYRKAHFNTGNLVVTGSGIAHDTLKALVEKHFHALAAGKEQLPASPYVGGDLKMRADMGGKSFLGLAFPVPAGADSKAYAVLHSLISSRIAAMNLPKHSLKTFHKQYSTGGLIGFYAAGGAAVAAGHLEAAVADLKTIASSANLSVDAAKMKVSIQNLASLEGKNSAEFLLRTATGTVAGADHRSVTAAQVSSAAAACVKATPTYVVLGATAGTPSYSSITKMFQ